jgi:hypothetical protein
VTGRRKRSGKPLSAVHTAQNSWAHFQHRLMRSSSRGWRAHAVTDYFRSVLLRADPGAAALSEEAVFHAVLTEAQRLEQANLALARRRRERDVDGHDTDYTEQAERGRGDNRKRDRG